MRRQRRYGKQRGFTLIELLISLLLLSLAMTLAMKMWVEGARIMAETGRTARDPITSLAAQRIRADVQEALAIPYGVPGSELVLDRAKGRVVYRKEGSFLVREIQNPPGTILSRRPVLDQVSQFFWRELSPGVVEVAFAVHTRSRLHVAALTGRVNKPAPGKTRVVRLVLALRGGGKRW